MPPSQAAEFRITRVIRTFPLAMSEGLSTLDIHMYPIAEQQGPVLTFKKTPHRIGRDISVVNRDTDELKRLAIVALVSEDELVDRLVLKGGNALSLAYNLGLRASFDLDFSIEGEFDGSELADLTKRIEFRFKQAFEPAGYAVFDVRLEPKPENLSPELAEFWGGYSLEFRLITQQRYDELCGDLSAIRREAIPSRPGGKARFEIDISRHECCTGKKPIEIDEFTVYVYTPAMVVCEKIRAICQQMGSYTSLVKKHPAPRARDFFVIHQTVELCRVDLFTPESAEMLRNMFQAKRVPLDLLLLLDEQREFHRQDWSAVLDTVHAGVRLREFDFYFDFVVTICEKLAKLLASRTP